MIGIPTPKLCPSFSYRRTCTAAPEPARGPVGVGVGVALGEELADALDPALEGELDAEGVDGEVVGLGGEVIVAARAVLCPPEARMTSSALAAAATTTTISPVSSQGFGRATPTHHPDKYGRNTGDLTRGTGRGIVRQLY
jgi:hypothetical protein